MTLALKTAAAVAGFLLVAPAAAVAQNAITTDDTPLRAGPGPDFPRLAIIPEDAGVRIHGCIAGYDWCDVSWRYERGWVRGRNLSYVWNGRYVIIEDWGPRIGLPVIGFSVRDYWTRYYSNRPFFEQRERWFERDRGRWERRDWDRRDDRQRDGHEFERRDFERRGDGGLREERREFRQRDELGGAPERREQRRDDERGANQPRGFEQRQNGGVGGGAQREDRDDQRAQRREQRDQRQLERQEQRQERREERREERRNGGERGERM